MIASTPGFPLAVMIGGMRCGTRAFLRYMKQHPQICVHETAHDPHFFSKDSNWEQGLDWYLSGWNDFDPQRHRYGFESSTHYTKYPQVRSVPERMLETGLDFRFILSARDPIKRVESHFIHNVGKGYIDPGSEKRESFLTAAARLSRYAMQLGRYREHFPKDRIHVFKQEDLLTDPAKVMAEVVRFLELDDYRFRQVKRVETKFRAPTEGARLTSEEVAWLRQELQEDVAELRAEYGVTTEGWSLFNGEEDREPAPRPSVLHAIGSRLRQSVAGATPALAAKTNGAPRIFDFAKQTAPASLKGNRYAMLTVDTEALPRRASEQHVRRLIWGEFDNGTAGIREMCSITGEVGGKLVFFVDTCETLFYGEEIIEVLRWLHEDGQDVQLHTHPEQLPPDFWAEHGFEALPRFLNEYQFERARFTLAHFSDIIAKVTGKPVLAFRAGSFRWNGDTIRALQDVGIPMSFNNRIIAYNNGKCSYSEPTNLPFLWDNGVIEVPLTEFQAGRRLTSFKFPVGQKPRQASDGMPGPDPMQGLRTEDNPFLVLLLHSWSLLYWDHNRFAEYRDDQRIEELRTLVHRIARDYDIITCEDFLGLKEAGKIDLSHSVAVANAA